MNGTIVTKGTLIETLLPKDTNAAGHIFGGVVMSLMDKTSAVTAIRYCKKRVVTASADQITFHTPIFVGEVLKSTASVIYSGKTSLDLEVIVEVENILDGSIRKGASGYFTMVAVDEKGKPTPVPPFQPNDALGWEKHNQAQARKDAKGLKKKQG
ncbi:MAG: acyl-CoA thioesterase [Thermincolia bacterium]